MKMIVAVLLTVIGLASLISAQEVKTQYNRFKDSTIISLNLNNVAVNRNEEADLYLLLFYTHKGTKNATKAPVAFSFTRSAPRKGFSVLPKLYAIADGERFDLGESLRGESDVNSIGSAISISQDVFVEVPYDQFQKLAAAKSVEFQLDRFEFSLKQNQLDKIREFAGRIKVE